MFEPVETVDKIIENVRQYQVPVQARVVRPSCVKTWHYIPSLDMVGAAEFAGYKDIRVDYFAGSHVNPLEADHHLQATGWFRQMEETEPDYIRANSLAESVGKVILVHLGASPCVLKDSLDKENKS